MSEYGTLMDYTTGQPIGPATAEQAAAQGRRVDEPGAFRVDRDGQPCADNADEAVFGPTRVVYVQQS